MAWTAGHLGSIRRYGPPPTWRFTRRFGLAVAALGVALLAVSPAVAAHPAAPVSSATGSAAAPVDPLSAATSPAATPATAALICLAGIAFPIALAARRSRRTGAVAIAALLVGLAGETAIHSAHHLDAPAQGERCPAASASQHLAGLDPDPGVPLIDRPAAIAMVSLPAPLAAAHVVLDGEQARAPPASPA